VRDSAPTGGIGMRREMGGAAVALLALAPTACRPGAEPAPGASRPVVVREVVVPPPASCCADVERGLLVQLNAARTDPTGYARQLESRLPYFRGALFQRPTDRIARETREGAAAVREAVSALRATPPRPALRRSEGMSRAAADHVRDQGPRGAVGHDGRDGSTTGSRVNRYGTWGVRLTESISYGPATAHDVIADLLIDDGVPNRGHRRNLLDPDVRVAGVACGAHGRFGVMCVIDLAGDYTEKQ